MDDILFTLVKDSCKDYDVLISIVRGAIKLICYAIPIIIIVLTIIDVAKVATAGNVDDKMKKETSQKIVSRLIYAIIVFLVPTVVSLVFRLVNTSSNGTVDINNDGNGCDCSIISIYLEDCN